MNHKPMLAVDCGGVDTLTFPLVISPKMDGVRAIISRDGVLARSLKPIPNVHVQELLKGLPVGLDGELLAGDPTAPDVYRKTVSMVMSDDKPVDGLVYHVFDVQSAGDFVARHAWLFEWSGRSSAAFTTPVEMVSQVVVKTPEALEMWEHKWVDAGYEGIILRQPGSPYKHGRSTRKEGYLLKLKRFVDGEALVIGVTELMHNGNEAKTNELGRTARSHKKAGMVPTGTMGTLIVRDTKTGVEFEIGTGFTAEDRKIIWNEKRHPEAYEWAGNSPLIGRLVKYKHFPSGAKDKPRHPVFLGWRDKRDT